MSSGTVENIHSILSHPVFLLFSSGFLLFSISLFYQTICFFLQGLITIYILLNLIFIGFLFKFFSNYSNFQSSLILFMEILEKSWISFRTENSSTLNEEKIQILETIFYWIRYFFIFLFFPSCLIFCFLKIGVQIFQKFRNEK